MAKKQKPTITTEAVEVYPPDACPAPACIQPGAHKHLTTVDHLTGDVTYTEPLPIDPVEIPLEPLDADAIPDDTPEPETEPEPTTEVEQLESDH